MPAELDKRVKRLKRSKHPPKNPFALARAQLGSDAEIKARRKRKRRK